MLADNRHYTFYLWKNLLRRHALIKYALIPFYLFGFWSIRDLFGAVSAGACACLFTRDFARAGPRKSLLWQLILLVCVAAVLIPTPLLEFRYFIVPFLLLQLHEHTASSNVVFLNCLGNLLVNAAVIFVFLRRPFTWPDGSIARFLW